jgi:capsular polysaccharide biosynthesis protein
MREGTPMAVTSAEGVICRVVIPADPAETIPPPLLTYSGPTPAELQEVARYLIARLYEAETGRIYVGAHRTTLMLGGDRYFAGVSQPSSAEVTSRFSDWTGHLELPGVAAILYANGAGRLFSHWMFDVLPKIDVLRRAGWMDRDIDHYVINGENPAFMKESLDRLGIPSAKIVPVDDVVISAKRLLIPSRIRLRFATPPWARRFVRETFGDPASRRGPRNSPPRLYISRAKARRRRIINEEQVRDALEKRGFVTAFAEDHSIAEFARIVAGAEQIVAPHGAGLANLVFGGEGLKVLEMYSAHIVAEYWLLTSGIGGRYHLLAGQDGNGRYPWEEGAYAGLSAGDRNQADFHVGVEDLQNALESLDSEDSEDRQNNA